VNIVGKIPIKIKEEEIMERKEWSRKKTFILYLCSIPFIAGLLVYWNMNQSTTVGTASLLIGSIILFAEVEVYLREVLESKRRKKGGQ
jgi:uncharacterized membrane protein